MLITRLFVFVIGLVLVQNIAAQHLPVKGDFYVLVDSPSVKHATVIRNVSDKDITIKIQGGKQIISTGYLAAFQYQSRYFQAFENFYLKSNNPNSRVRRAFAERLDSGQVSLFAYRYSRATIALLGVSGTLLPGIGYSIQTAYLLRDASTQPVTTIPSDDLLTIAGGQAFRTALQPFLLSRPDLLTPLAAKHFHIEDLADIIRALNSNKPFVRTNRTPFGVD